MTQKDNNLPRPSKRQKHCKLVMVLL
uniref:Uncharacterized protein n=1 Tax=Zea mays TaxID=4577 RepID=B4FW09_MAIZE|nr:unknown [Zea mays]